MIEKLGYLHNIGREEIYNDGRPYLTKYSTEKALEIIIEKLNEVIEVINSNEK